MRLIHGGQGRSAEDVEASAAGCFTVLLACAAMWLLAWLAWRCFA
jgi:hypothetical protein